MSVSYPKHRIFNGVDVIIILKLCIALLQFEGKEQNNLVSV
jgi:hypothetical protein